MILVFVYGLWFFLIFKSCLVFILISVYEVFEIGVGLNDGKFGKISWVLLYVLLIVCINVLVIVLVLMLIIYVVLNLFFIRCFLF